MNNKSVIKAPKAGMITKVREMIDSLYSGIEEEQKYKKRNKINKGVKKVMLKQNLYKWIFTIKIRMFPSDPKGSLDDYTLSPRYLLMNMPSFAISKGGPFNGRNISIYR